MAINITNVLSTLQNKISSANTSSSTQDLIYLLDAAKKSHDGGTIESYPNISHLPTANSTSKMIAFNEDTRTLLFNLNGTWTPVDVTVPAANVQSTFQGSSYGYTSGGDTGGGEFSTSNVIDKFPFASDGNASDVGDLTAARSDVAGQSSSTYGYTSGGSSTNVIDKFPFASDGNASDVGDLTVARSREAGQSSSTHGYSSGGSAYPAPATISGINKFPFASDGNASYIGSLSTARSAASGQSSATYGYCSGGSPYSRIIDKFPFASDGNAYYVGDLTDVSDEGQQAGRYSPAGQSSSDNGYASGGMNGDPLYTTSIDKISFASDTNATSAGSLTTARGYAAGQSSSTYGYTSGGREASGFETATVNVIDKFTFATDANATDVGDLTVARSGTAGQQV